MINLIDELTIYEVVFASYDEDGNYEECVDDVTIMSPSYLSPQDVIEEAILQGEIDPENRLVQVYEARSATISVNKGNIELSDYDTSTGMSGSPIYEVYYDQDGDKITDL